jgi:selenide,water dikinase
MLASTTLLNTPGPRLARLESVHALTDVTGFGLLGHLLEVCRGSSVGARVRWRDVPVLDGVNALLARGIKTGASARNWAGYGQSVDLGGFGSEVQALFSDPQTSGGLLVACAPEAVDEVLATFHGDGFARAAVIGEVIEGPAHVTVC